jgi:hypothetical protein
VYYSRCNVMKSEENSGYLRVKISEIKRSGYLASSTARGRWGNDGAYSEVESRAKSVSVIGIWKQKLPQIFFH